MLKRPQTDFWRVGIVPLPIEELNPQRLRALKTCIAWLPDPGPWRYLADPFGVVRDGLLHVFVEAYDYRTKRGVIERHEFELGSLRWRKKQVVLSMPHHLSYPYVFEHHGDLWMIPESHQADEVALYRAGANLDTWTKECVLLEGLPFVDATIAFHHDRWWMFYGLVGPKARDRRELHIAWAPALTGPWCNLTGNPVRVDLGASRPAGRPFAGDDGRLLLPVQDSVGGYGRGVRLVRFSTLEVGRVVQELVPGRFTGDLASDIHCEGLHTLSACGPVTLIDVKRIDRSRKRQLIDLRRRVQRLLRVTPMARR